MTHKHDDDFDLPTVVPLQEFKGDTDFEDESTYDITPDTAITAITDQDFAPLSLDSLDKKVLASELADCEMYLRNIHKGFRYVTSTKSLIALVGAGIGVHKHRRQVLSDLKAKQSPVIEIDEHGNIKKPS